MSAGDAQRVWFSEMLDDLKNDWSIEMTWDELAVFCRSMTEKRRRIKEERGIKPPQMTCKNCGGPMVLPPISIRSALFALRKIGAINDDQLKKLDRDWDRYRKQNGLNAYGNRSEP